jgi:glycosyltransferase involved in cell wall biosynthesis
MRVAQLINSLDYGGAENVVADLARTQSLQGDAVRLVCMRGLGPQPVAIGPLIASGVKFESLDKPDGLHFGTVWKLAAYLRKERIEVLHSHNHIVHHYAVAAGRLAGTPVILNTLHGTASLLNSARWSRSLFWASCFAGHRLVSVCPAVDAVVRAVSPLPARKLCVVDNGIDLTRFLSITPRAADATVTFGTVGRLDPVKDHATLLNAFAMLRARWPSVRLRILGDGPIRADLERLAHSLGIDDSVRFEGFSLDTARFFASIDAYVISSRSEGLPLTLLEAMSASLPIVATSVGGIPDVLRKAGNDRLAMPEDPTRLAAAMEKVLLLPDRTEVGRQNRRTAAEHYSAERMTADYRKLYAMLLAEGSGHSRAPEQ